MNSIYQIENPAAPELAGCIATSTGAIVDLMNIDPATIDLIDIAHGLAFNSRWNGHTIRWYSIAEHCCRVHDNAPDHLKLLCLFHGAEEAYWGDVVRPLKMVLKMLAPEILEKMKDTRRAIFKKFGIVDGPEYKPFDDAELMWDFQNLVLKPNHQPLTPYQAKDEWLLRAAKLLKK